MDDQTAGAPASRRERDVFAFDRADRWSLAVVLGLVSIVAAVTTVVGPLAGWAKGEALRVPFFSEVDVPALSGTGLGHGLGEYDLIIPDPTTAQRLLDLVPGLAWLALVVAACWLVLRVMGDVGRADPFQLRNVRRLRQLAALLAIGWPVLWIAQATIAFAILTDLDLGDVGPRAMVTFPLLPVLVGLVVALLAEAFKAGIRLREDVDGLV